MIFYVSFLLRKLDGTSFRSISRQNIIESKRDIPDFPKYMMPDQVLSNLGASLHIYFISAYFGVTEVGYIAIVSSLLYVPITVLRLLSRMCLGKGQLMTILLLVHAGSCI